jgi:hypothetical protein
MVTTQRFHNVLRIRDVYIGSRIPDPTFCIPDPGSDFFPSRFPAPGSASKNLSIQPEKNGF